MALIPSSPSTLIPTDYFEGSGFFGFELSGAKIACFVEDIKQGSEINLELPNIHVILCGNMETSSTEIKVRGASIIALNNSMTSEKNISLISEGSVYTLACHVKAPNGTFEVHGKHNAVVVGTVSARILTVKENLKQVMKEKNGELFKETLIDLLELVQESSPEKLLPANLSFFALESQKDEINKD